jgi:WD40 repeat protein
LKGLKSYYGGISCSLNLAEDIVLIANQENLEIWDFKRDAFDVVKAHKCQINCLAKLTENYFLTGSNNGLVKIWDFSLGKAIKIFNQHWPVTNILIKPRSN